MVWLVAVSWLARLPYLVEKSVVACVHVLQRNLQRAADTGLGRAADANRGALRRRQALSRRSKRVPAHPSIHGVHTGSCQPAPYSHDGKDARMHVGELTSRTFGGRDDKVQGGVGDADVVLCGDFNR